MPKKMDKRKAGIRSGIVSAFIIIMLLFAFNMPKPTFEQSEDGMSWHVVWEGSLAQAMGDSENTTAGANGTAIRGIYFVNHTTTPTDTYAQNDSDVLQNYSNTSNLAYSGDDNFYLEMAHSVNFDIVVRVAGNKTHCGNTTAPGGVFIDSYLRVNITGTDAPISIAALTSAHGVVTHNVSTEYLLYMNFYMNDTDAGLFTLSKGDSCDITVIRLEAYY